MLKNIANRFILFVVIFNGLFFLVHAALISQTLSDGTHINPNTNVTPWRSNGVAITLTDSQQNELHDGDIILEIEGQPLADWLDRVFCPFSDCHSLTPPELKEGVALTYTIEREGDPQTVRAILRPYPFWEVLRRSWGGLAFPVVSYLIFLILFFKRSQEPSIIALAIAASGLLGSMGWLFGLSTMDILVPSRFWLYRFATEVIYWLSVIGVLHFALVFPRPLPLIQRHRWIPFVIYPASYIFYGFFLFISTQLAANKMLWMAYTSNAQAIVISLFYGLAMLCLVLNYRSLKEENERQQVRIVVVTSGLLLLLSIVFRSLPVMLLGKSLITSNEIAVFALIVPLSIAFAVQRHKLWGIDVLINRTLVFTSVSVTIVGLYILIVSLISRVFQTDFNLATSIVATGVVAVLFQPVRLALQNLVNRAMYGKRDDPVAVLTELAQQMETAGSHADILPNMIQTIAQTLKIPYVAIWLPDDDNQYKVVAQCGESSEHMEMLPLMYQNEEIGQLVVALRGAHESFDRHERRLLHSIAALTANTVRAVQLSNELRRSRRRIVTAREEERRRLRRDLHDGLGPQLASQTLGLEAVEQLLSTNPQKAHELLASLKAQAQEAITDVRHLVYELRPPTLDDLGLLGALQQSALRYERGELRFTFDVPQPLPDLPAAVETAVYRISQEAMTNIVRHAQATQATIGLTCTNNHLIVRIQDNGIGVPPNHPSGVGLQSMQERAAELNGRCMIESMPDGGTKVEAHLPLEVNDA